MSLQCPRCHSPKVASFHHAMRPARPSAPWAVSLVASVLPWLVVGPVRRSAHSPGRSVSPSAPCLAPSSAAWPAGWVAVHLVLSSVSHSTVTSWPITFACSAVTVSTCRPDPATALFFLTHH